MRRRRIHGDDVGPLSDRNVAGRRGDGDRVVHGGELEPDRHLVAGHAHDQRQRHAADRSVQAMSDVDARRDRGSLSVVLMLMVVIVLAGGALIVDGGRALSARRHAANTAEAAARFAVTSQSLSTDIDPERARESALSYATR